LPIGAAYFAIYYVVFRWAIVRFDLKTPGREDEDSVAPAPTGTVEAGGAGAGWVHALGGANNLQAIDACTTRLRLTVRDNVAVNEPEMRRLGARGFVRPSAGTLQVVVGPIADQLAGDIRAAMRSGDSKVEPPAHAGVDPGLAARLAGLLGGRTNVVDVEAWSTRLVINVRDPALIEPQALESAARGAVRVGTATWHVIVGPTAAQTAAALRAL
jgi:N-acetylglucosamine PTS system EIICBA or EIICB component